MKVFFVYEDMAEEGIKPLYIASTKEKAVKWIEENTHKALRRDIEIDEVEVDNKEGMFF